MSCNCNCSCNEEKLSVGDVLYGFCGGAFGRDSYGDKTVEAIGRDWVIARSEYRDAQVAFGNPNRLVQFKIQEEYQ